jgi:hypothetical protein
MGTGHRGLVDLGNRSVRTTAGRQLPYQALRRNSAVTSLSDGRERSHATARISIRPSDTLT